MYSPLSNSMFLYSMDSPANFERYASAGDLDIRNLKTIKDRVSYLLNRFPETRNSDKELWLRYLENFLGIDTGNTSLDVAAESELPSQMSLSRARAELQNRYNLYLPTRPDVIIHRQKRRQAYVRVFQNLDSLDGDVSNDSNLYSDESGLNDAYLLFGFFTTINGKDMFDFYRQVLVNNASAQKKPYFHFADLQRNDINRYYDFFRLAVEQKSARVFMHIFRRDDLRGKQKDLVLKAYEVSAIETIRNLQSQGLIDEYHRFELFPDAGQDSVFYKELEQNIEPKLLERKIKFRGIRAADSKTSYAVQVADIVTGAFNRVINSPGSNHKDELAGRILDFWGVESPLVSCEIENLTVVNHNNV